MGALVAFHGVEDESGAEYDRAYRDEQAPRRDATPANTFGMVPVSIYGLVDPGAVCVYAAIAAHAKPNGYASPSIETLTNLIKTISRPTVMKHIQALAGAGVIVISEHRRGSTRSFEYFLPLHPPVKKLDRSVIIDNHPTGQNPLPVTGQKTLPAQVKNLYRYRSKILTVTIIKREIMICRLSLQPQRLSKRRPLASIRWRRGMPIGLAASFRARALESGHTPSSLPVPESLTTSSGKSSIGWRGNPGSSRYHSASWHRSTTSGARAR